MEQAGSLARWIVTVRQAGPEHLHSVELFRAMAPGWLASIRGELLRTLAAHYNPGGLPFVREQVFHAVATLYNHARLPFLRVHASDRKIIMEHLERLERRLARRTRGRGKPWRGQGPFEGNLNTLFKQTHRLMVPPSAGGRPRACLSDLRELVDFVCGHVESLRPMPSEDGARRLVKFFRLSGSGNRTGEVVKEVKALLENRKLSDRTVAVRVVTMMTGLKEESVRKAASKSTRRQPTTGSGAVKRTHVWRNPQRRK